MKEEETSQAFHRWFSHQIGSIEFLTFYILRDGLYNRLAMYNGVGIQQAVAMVLSAHSILTIATKFGLTACIHVMGIGLAVGPPTGLSGAL